HLKLHLAQTDSNSVTAVAPSRPVVTNHLAQALANFDRLITTFTNSPLVGRANLNRGWCYWSEGKIPESAAAFRAAVARLTPSEDLAVARFKLADALFVQKDFTNALQNYRAALDLSRSWPRLKDTLASQSLYQMLRASLELKD